MSKVKKAEGMKVKRMWATVLENFMFSKGLVLICVFDYGSFCIGYHNVHMSQRRRSSRQEEMETRFNNLRIEFSTKECFERRLTADSKFGDDFYKYRAFQPIDFMCPCNLDKLPWSKSETNVSNYDPVTAINRKSLADIPKENVNVNQLSSAHVYVR